LKSIHFFLHFTFLHILILKFNQFFLLIYKILTSYKTTSPNNIFRGNHLKYSSFKISSIYHNFNIKKIVII